MSTQPDDPTLDNDDDQGEHEVRMTRKDIRALERRAKAGTEAQAEALASRRELALLRAGIPDTGVGKLFAKAYDGDLDPEAIKEAAAEYGILQDAKPSVPADELAAHRRMADASAGAGNASQADIGAELAAAKTQEEVMAIAVKHDLKGIDLKSYA